MLRPLFALGLLALGSACGSTSSKCNPSSCADGCCSADDRCVEGVELLACGVGGHTCNVCSGSQLCLAQSCTLSGAGGGSASGGGTGSAGGTASGGGSATGGGSGSSDGGVVISATPETWTWVDFPDAVCGNGVATGLGVNLTSRSADLFIYLEGGGACWDALTCFTLGAAANLATGYTKANFLSDAFTSATNLSRTEAKNPFKDMSYVFVPYCTGDVHAGDAIRSYDATKPLVYHKGGKNMESYLHRLAATFPSATRVFLTGSSAGGYGAQLNYSRVAAAFPNAAVHVLADCGPMVNPTGTLLSTWLAAWNPSFPTTCPGCPTDFTAYPEWLITQHPTSRIGLLAYERDPVIEAFFGFTTPAEIKAQTDALLTARYDGKANARYFVLPDVQHVMLGGLYTLGSVDGGVSLDAWVSGWVSGAPAWSNSRP